MTIKELIEAVEAASTSRTKYEVIGCVTIDKTVQLEMKGTPTSNIEKHMYGAGLSLTAYGFTSENLLEGTYYMVFRLDKINGKTA